MSGGGSRLTKKKEFVHGESTAKRKSPNNLLGTVPTAPTNPVLSDLLAKGFRLIKWDGR